MYALKKKTRYHWEFLAFHCVPIWIQFCNFHSALSVLALCGISGWVKTGAVGPLTVGQFLPQGALGRWGMVVVFLGTWRNKCMHLFSCSAHPGNIYFWLRFFQTSLKAASLKQSWVRILQDNIFIAWGPNNRVLCWFSLCFFFCFVRHQAVQGARSQAKHY